MWVVSPVQHFVLVYRCAAERDRLLKSMNSLDGEEVIPGFIMPLAELFQPLAF